MFVSSIFLCGTPKSSIKKIGYSIIFTIHFGENNPIFGGNTHKNL